MLKPVAGAVYYLAGILVKPATKELAQRLIDKGFRLATKGMKDSKVPINKITDSNIVTYIARAIQAAKKLRAPPKLDPKTGRPNNPKNLGGSKMTTAGGRGQSALGRRVGLSKMKNYGKVGPSLHLYLKEYLRNLQVVQNQYLSQPQHLLVLLN